MIRPASSLDRVGVMVVVWMAGLAGLGGCDPELRTGTPAVPGDSAVKTAAALPYGAECTPVGIQTEFQNLMDDQTMAERFDIREYHDCQRLPVQRETRAEPEYSPVLQVWATPSPDDLGETAFTDDEAGYLVAMVHTYDTGTAGETDYAPLGIREGWNCLYVKPVGGRWLGVMGRCGVGRRPSRAAADIRLDSLVGQRMLVPRSSYGEVPTVARWDLGTRRGTGTMVGLIGIRCGANAWCRFGPRDVNGGNPGCGSAVAWCDEQYLAVPAGGSGRLRPSRQSHGTVAPVAGLDTLDVPHFTCRGCASLPDTGWVPVATVSLRSDVVSQPTDGAGIYRRKLNLLGPGRRPTNDVSFRAVPDATGKLAWQARIEASDGTVAFREVMRHEHPGVDVPGTARWAWSENDEGVWARCGFGCCTVTDRAVDIP